MGKAKSALDRAEAAELKKANATCKDSCPIKLVEAATQGTQGLPEGSASLS